jgi:hypothetical protein
MWRGLETWRGSPFAGAPVLDPTLIDRAVSQTVANLSTQRLLKWLGGQSLYDRAVSILGICIALGNQVGELLA